MPILSAYLSAGFRAAADQVWPWIAQLGQGRGGFYSYDFLENLVGCDIHSADRIVPEWQGVAVGDEVRFAPEVGLVVASLEGGRSLVLRGGVPMGNGATPYDFTWLFALRWTPPHRPSRVLRNERAGDEEILGRRLWIAGALALLGLNAAIAWFAVRHRRAPRNRLAGGARCAKC